MTIAPRSVRRGRQILFGLACLVPLLCSCRRPTEERKAGESVVVDAPSKASGYAGDQRCASCHEDITESYQDHSMGRSLAAVSPEDVLPAAHKATFEADGFRYSVRKQGPQWIHRQVRIGKDGTEGVAIEAEVSHVVGSGNHGQSFLVQQDDFLFLSPITWYPDDGVWALSPGYETNNSQFNRPVVEVCLYCHANRAPAVPDCLNRYHDPPFEGLSIGCERCHGPGAAHVLAQEAGNETTSLIVNPGHLTPDLRDAVCQQCHLSGVARVLKPGKSLYDFRPGQPLSSTYTIFTQPSPEQAFVGHVEQMHQSACFRGGELSCISCHDPHRLPTRDERVTFYRDRCLACHATDGCLVPENTRRASSAQDSCMDCHMPTQATEVRHAATTNHAIPRGTPNALVSHRELATIRAFPPDRASKATARDRAIAFVRTTDSANAPPRAVVEAKAALNAAVTSEPADIEAMESLIAVYLAEGDVAQGMQLAQRLLAQHPRRERTLTMVADVLSQLSREAEALPYWKRAIDVNPHMPRYWYGLGRAYARTDQWFVCRQSMQTAKQRFPTSMGVRQLLVESNLRLSEPGPAESEFQEIRDYRPNGLDRLEEWYESVVPQP